MSTDKQNIDDLVVLVSQLQNKIASLEAKSLSREEKIASEENILSERYGYKGLVVHEIFHDVCNGNAISEEEKEFYEKAVLDGWSPDWLDELDVRWVQFINSDIYKNKI